MKKTKEMLAYEKCIGREMIEGELTDWVISARIRRYAEKLIAKDKAYGWVSDVSYLIMATEAKFWNYNKYQVRSEVLNAIINICRDERLYDVHNKMSIMNGEDWNEYTATADDKLDRLVVDYNKLTEDNN